MIERVALFTRVHEDPALESLRRLEMKISSYSTIPLIFSVVLFWTLEAGAFQPRQNANPEYNKLTKEEQWVILGKGTERRFSKYADHKADGTYICVRCNTPLFDSTRKFENPCGWPCFEDAIADAIEQTIAGRQPSPH